MKFLSPEVALCKCSIGPYVEYCCHVLAGVPNSYLELLHKQICRTVGPLLAATLKPLIYCQNVARLYLFYRYYFGRYVHLNQLNWFCFLFVEGGLLVILIDCMIFLLPFLDVIRLSMSAVSFLAQLVSVILCQWNAFL